MKTQLVTCPDGGRCGWATHDRNRGRMLEQCQNKAKARASSPPTTKTVAPALSTGRVDSAFDYAAHGDPYKTSMDRTKAILAVLDSTANPLEIAERLHAEGWATPAEAESGVSDVEEMQALLSEAVSTHGAKSSVDLAKFLESEGVFRDVTTLRRREENKKRFDQEYSRARR